MKVLLKVFVPRAEGGGGGRATKFRVLRTSQ